MALWQLKGSKGLQGLFVFWVKHSSLPHDPFEKTREEWLVYKVYVRKGDLKNAVTNAKIYEGNVIIRIQDFYKVGSPIIYEGLVKNCAL